MTTLQLNPDYYRSCDEDDDIRFSVNIDGQYRDEIIDDCLNIDEDESDDTIDITPESTRWDLGDFAPAILIIILGLIVLVGCGIIPNHNSPSDDRPTQHRYSTLVNDHHFTQLAER